jgi:hypothetical protein
VIGRQGTGHRRWGEAQGKNKYFEIIEIAFLVRSNSFLRSPSVLARPAFFALPDSRSERPAYLLEGSAQS